MFGFMIPKTKLRAYNIKKVPMETFQIAGIGQINPYCSYKFENETLITIIDIAYDSKQYDEREGMILTKFFIARRCPECKQVELVPTRLRINRDTTYLKYEEEVAYDAFEEHPTKRHFPTIAEAYCNNCSSCFEIRLKNKDPWIKFALGLRGKDLIAGAWDEYYLD